MGGRKQPWRQNTASPLDSVRLRVGKTESGARRLQRIVLPTLPRCHWKLPLSKRPFFRIVSATFFPGVRKFGVRHIKLVKQVPDPGFYNNLHEVQVEL